MKKIAILGSTGSIGTQTLEVVREHSDELSVVALAAGRNKERLMEQIKEFPNQERIKLCCLDKCICCKTCDDEKVRCLRQFGTCESYKEIEF